MTSIWNGKSKKFDAVYIGGRTQTDIQIAVDNFFNAIPFR